MAPRLASEGVSTPLEEIPGFPENNPPVGRAVIMTVGDVLHNWASGYTVGVTAFATVTDRFCVAVQLSVEVTATVYTMVEIVPGAVVGVMIVDE